MSNSVIDYGVKRPIGERINFRLVLIIAVFSMLVGYPVYALVNERLSHGVQKSGDHLSVDLKALGNFKFNEMTGSVDDVPSFDRALDGKFVALEGYIAPTDVSGDKVNHFQFVYNVAKCCYGGPPQVQERVFATIPNGEYIPYTDQEIRLVGNLHVLLSKDAGTGKVLTVYTLDVKRAEPL